MGGEIKKCLRKRGAKKNESYHRTAKRVQGKLPRKEKAVKDQKKAEIRKKDG